VEAPSKPGEPDHRAIRQLLRAIDPDLRLVGCRALTGGVSAQVTAIDAGRAAGGRERLVLRQYGAANLRSDPHVAAHEYRLLSLLHAAGLPVPRPRHADESCSIVPVPCLVTEFIDGAQRTDPAQLTEPGSSFTGQLAAVLARLHTAAFTLADAPYLAHIRSIATRKIAAWPVQLDESLSEPAVRAALAGIWPPPQVNRPVLLHGDYWPGNTLWREGRLVCVTDWEDAVFGDPLADVGNTRMELCMGYGAAAASEFTRQYRALMPDLDLTALAHWDLYAALRHAGRLAEWGLSDANLARLQAGHREFTAIALAQVPTHGG
jgi:aminoglycoside phosphotransferase (APT) family kinase protein